ncbi:MAG: hypothetical protein IJT23_00010 [Clostridia bacterium]|nr:hypothetical protein [Clostridia bacterium]
MRENTKKVMILNNFTSPYISEAIIILKEYSPEFDTHVIHEAERIVNEYLNKRSGQPIADRPKKRFVKLIIISAAIALSFSLGYLLNR